MRFKPKIFKASIGYSIILNNEHENIIPNMISTATAIPVPPIIAACSFTKFVATTLQPFAYSVSGDGASIQGFRWPPYVTWQQDSGTKPFQSLQLSMPQHLRRLCVSCQACVTARRLPYNFSDECISWRIVCCTFSRKTTPNIPPISIVTNIRNIMMKYCKFEELRFFYMCQRFFLFFKNYVPSTACILLLWQHRDNRKTKPCTLVLML